MLASDTEAGIMPRIDTNLGLTTDLDVLDSFLTSDRAPENSMGLSDLDGFLTAIVIGPELVMPIEWLPVVWGDEEPAFDSHEEAKKILSAIMARYNEIVSAFRKSSGQWIPLFWETDDGKVIVEDWAAGFLEGVQLRIESWVPLLDDPDAGVFMTPIVLAGSAEGAAEKIGIDSRQLEAILEDAPENIPVCVVAIDRFWREQQADKPLLS
jgi:uncharacterized protein